MTQVNSDDESAPDILLARQPIFDRNLKLFGYELLYRQNHQSEHAQFLCGDHATSSVLLNNYASLSQATEHHRVPAFINITESLLKADELLPVNPNQVILEVLEDVTPDDALLASVKKYKELGFKIALDDYPFTDSFERLLEYADFIKVDVLNYKLSELTAKLDHLKNFNTQLLAEKVEDYDDYVECLKRGFHLFQGYFFERPQIVRGKTISSNKQLILDLLKSVYSADADPEKIAIKVSQDAQLSYKLLRIINSAAYGLNRKIHSVKEAIVFLGFDQLKRWITLLSFSSSDAPPSELLRTLLIRGRSCELIAKQLNKEDPESYFTAGLFSGIDSLFNIDLNYLISELPLDNDIKLGILQYHGVVGEILKATVQFEHADWDNLSSAIDPQIINQCYFSAIRWCDEMTANF
ncbi:MAG: HDOD domain-containing protein [Gammaproteobacteria bacterium]|nr:HDOD domain-containing protein [Gammaproteobacteria bacterium]